MVSQRSPQPAGPPIGGDRDAITNVLSWLLVPLLSLLGELNEGAGRAYHYQREVSLRDLRRDAFYPPETLSQEFGKECLLAWPGEEDRVGPQPVGR